MTESTNIGCKRPFATPPHLVCLHGAARWPLFSPPACRQPRGCSLPGWGRPFFVLDWPALEPQSTRQHMQKRRGGRWGRPLLLARALCAHALPVRWVSATTVSPTTYLWLLSGVLKVAPGMGCPPRLPRGVYTLKTGNENTSHHPPFPPPPTHPTPPPPSLPGTGWRKISPLLH
jgi:hypothetical protein